MDGFTPAERKQDADLFGLCKWTSSLRTEVVGGFVEGGRQQWYLIGENGMTEGVPCGHDSQIQKGGKVMKNWRGLVAESAARHSREGEAGHV